MPDVRDFPFPDGASDDPMIVALRALPQLQPRPDLWPHLAAQLHVASAQRTRPLRGTVSRRRWLWVAAAAVFITVLVPRLLSPPSNEGNDTVAAAQVDKAWTQHLIAQSQWLERLVEAEALSPLAQDGDQMLLELGLRERIRVIDAALAAPGSESQSQLWQARVGALRQLAEVQWAGRQEGWADARSNTAALRPAVQWSN